MIVAVLQARCTSRRLPGKVLADVTGRPMITRQLERLARAASFDRLVVATSVDPSDDALARLCEGEDVALFRGSLDDVLQRVLDAAAGAEHVVRLTADCPLADPALLDEVVARHVAGGFDYTSNTLRRTYPDGLDVEVARRSALETAAREARLPSEREHVTPFLYHHPERFTLGSVETAPDRSALRWTVDDPADLELVRAVYAELYPVRPDFTTADVLALLERRPDLGQLNEGTPTNAGYDLSRERDPR